MPFFSDIPPQMEQTVNTVHLPGTSNDGFFPKHNENTFLVIQGTLKSLGMHSKRRYETCTCSTC